MSPARAFATVFMAVFLVIFLSAAAVTFVLPEVYTADALVVATGADRLQLLQSEELLRVVAEKLKLPQTLAARYGENKAWDEKRVADYLRRSMQIEPVPKTDLVHIRVNGRSGVEAAELANEMANEAHREADAIRIVNQAVPPPRPSRPDKPLNLGLGALVGLVLGIMAGGVGAKLAVGFEGGTTMEPPTRGS